MVIAFVINIAISLFKNRCCHKPSESSTFINV